MVQKMNSGVFPPHFPVEPTDGAFVNAGEAAWRPLQAIEVVEWLRTHGYAVLGTEVFVFEKGSVQSVPYFQSVARKESEGWDPFVIRVASETINYLSAFNQRFAGEEDVYINLTWVSESAFQRLKAK